MSLSAKNKYNNKSTFTKKASKFNIKTSLIKPKIKILIITLTIILLTNSSTSHKCGFHAIQHKSSAQLIEESEENISESEKLLKERFLQFDVLDELIEKEYSPLRIYFDYTTMDSTSSSIKPELVNAIKTVLEDTKQMFENLISIKKYKSLLRIRACDNSIQIPSNIRAGIDTDLVIFPLLDSSIANTQVEAYATACAISSLDRRPIAGLIGFNSNFSLSKKNWRTYYRNLALHELTHVLVFNPNLFDFFKDPQGKEYNLYEVIRIKTINGLRRNLLAYPKLLAAAKNHFNCTTMEGVELENQGGQGTASAHWEARTLLGDYMIGLSFDDIAISEITLALFEDSGWYKINYYTGGLFKFGKNSGCDILQRKCISNDTSISPKEYCAKQSESLCQTNLLSRGFCYLQDDVRPDNFNYVYFQNPNKGGLFIADYCPIIAVPTSKDSYYNWNCIQGNSFYPQDYSEKISQFSACFMSNMVKSKSNLSSTGYRATCYEHSCDFQKKVLSIFIGTEKVNCPIQGGEIEVNNYNGKIICPDFNSICTYKIFCNDIYDCVMKKSEAANRVYDYEVKEVAKLPSEEIKPNDDTKNTKVNTTITNPVEQPIKNDTIIISENEKNSSIVDSSKPVNKTETKEEIKKSVEEPNPSETKEDIGNSIEKPNPSETQILIENSFSYFKFNGVFYAIILSIFL